jgi:hypothetical protein
MNHYCSYYQAQVTQEYCWFLVAIARSFEHVAFDRTLNSATSTFEFFVPEDTEHYFLEIMDCLHKKKIISQLEKLPYRLAQAEVQIPEVPTYG